VFIRPFRLSQALGKFSRQQSSSRDPAAVPSLGLSPAMYYGSGYISRKEFWTLGLVFGGDLPRGAIGHRCTLSQVLFGVGKQQSVPNGAARATKRLAGHQPRVFFCLTRIDPKAIFLESFT
jgi:hypothetical protein